MSRGDAADRDDIVVASLDSTSIKPLVRSVYRPAFAEPGHLLFVRDGELMAQPFDASSLTLRGEAVRVGERIETNLLTFNALFSVSRAGMLAYGNENEGTFRMVWFDRSGKQAGTVGELGFYTVPGLSPDGQRIAVAVGLNGKVWIYDLQRSTSSPLTLDAAPSFAPVWSPDGNQVVFTSTRTGDLYVKDLRGTAPEELLLKSPERITPTDWSRDGRFILYQVVGDQTREDLWIVPIDGDRKPQPYLVGPRIEQQGRFSPNGHWVAYTADVADRPEVFVQSFPKPGPPYQISNAGGGDPRWRADGKEMYFISSDFKLMSVTVNATADKFQSSLPKALFPIRVSGLTDSRTHYAVSPDSRRFLVVTSSEDAALTSITVLNWTALLKK